MTVNAGPLCEHGDAAKCEIASVKAGPLCECEHGDAAKRKIALALRELGDAAKREIALVKADLALKTLPVRYYHARV